MDSLSDKAKRLGELADRLEYLSNRADMLVASPEREAMHEFVAGRRESAGLFLELSRLTTDIFESLPADQRSVYEPAYRESFLELRKAMVDLQADWPLPAIFADIPGYQFEKARFNLKLEKFADHVRRQFLVDLKNWKPL